MTIAHRSMVSQWHLGLRICWTVLPEAGPWIDAAMLAPSARGPVTVEPGHSDHLVGALLSVVAVVEPYLEMVPAKEVLAGPKGMRIVHTLISN